MKVLSATIFSLFFAVAASGADIGTPAKNDLPGQPFPCGTQGVFRCLEEGLPEDAPQAGVVLTVDTTTNTAFLFRNGELVTKAPAATGMDKTLKKNGRIWMFRTPRGRHPVVRKIVDPVWVKPDWAFVEEGKAIPSANHPSRKVRGKLGRYALDLGDGILVHGTDDPSSLGKKASHGCIRLGDRMLEKVWNEASVGMIVYVF